MGEFTSGDLALLKDNGGNGSLMGFFVLLIFLYVMGGVGGPARGGAPGNFVTQAELTAGLNNQQTQNQLSQVLLTSANTKYDVGQLINQQTDLIIQQNNTNLVNAIQGFNQVNAAITNQTNVLSQQLMQLQAKMDSCCCEIKTQMLQNRLDDANAALVAANNQISNANQSQYILGQLGRFVAWAGTGAPATAATGT